MKIGFLDIVKFLIEKKVFVNIFDKEERMFLYWVFWNGFCGIVEYFINSGVNVN